MKYLNNQKPKRPDFRKLWPWRDWMTIGIGVLATDKRPTDTLVLLADTQGTFGDDYSMDRLHKIFKEPSRGIYATAAGGIDKAAEFFTLLCNVLKKHYSPEAYGGCLEAIHHTSDLYKRARFRFDVMPNYAHNPFELPEPFNETHLTPALLEEWQNFYFGCQLIIGAIDANGQGYLFHVDGVGGVENLSYPGIAAIGSGLEHAMFWLSYRNQHLGRSPRHAAYHAYEAKVMAEQNIYINEKLDLLIATKDKQWLMSDFNPHPTDAPFTTDELRHMFATYGPRNTDELTPKKVRPK